MTRHPFAIGAAMGVCALLLSVAFAALVGSPVRSSYAMIALSPEGPALHRYVLDHGLSGEDCEQELGAPGLPMVGPHSTTIIALYCEKE